MSVKTAYRTFFLPEWGGSVLKKHAAAWFTMRSVGLGEASPTSRIVNNGITMPRLRLVKRGKRSENSRRTILISQTNVFINVADSERKCYNMQENTYSYMPMC